MSRRCQVDGRLGSKEGVKKMAGYESDAWPCWSCRWPLTLWGSFPLASWQRAAPVQDNTRDINTFTLSKLVFRKKEKKKEEKNELIPRKQYNYEYKLYHFITLPSHLPIPIPWPIHIPMPFKRTFTPHHVSHVTCHMSGDRCQVSGVTCQVYF